MTGIEVKKILQNNGFSLKSVANSIGETPQNFNSMLNAQDIKTGILERIAKAIKEPLYFFYSDDKKTNSINNNSGVVIQGSTNLKGNNIDNRQYYSDSPDVLRAQVEEKDRLLREKDERIREKDERIREKDAYILELKEVICELKGK